MISYINLPEVANNHLPLTPTCIRTLGLDKYTNASWQSLGMITGTPLPPYMTNQDFIISAESSKNRSTLLKPKFRSLNKNMYKAHFYQFTKFIQCLTYSNYAPAPYTCLQNL